MYLRKTVKAAQQVLWTSMSLFLSLSYLSLFLSLYFSFTLAFSGHWSGSVKLSSGKTNSAPGGRQSCHFPSAPPPVSAQLFFIWVLLFHLLWLLELILRANPRPARLSLLFRLLDAPCLQWEGCSSTSSWWKWAFSDGERKSGKRSHQSY